MQTLDKIQKHMCRCVYVHMYMWLTRITECVIQASMHTFLWLLVYGFWRESSQKAKRLFFLAASDHRLCHVMSAPAGISSPAAICVFVSVCVCVCVSVGHWNQASPASQHRGHGCNSHSIRCVQIGGSNNSIGPANSLTVEARVQKSQIMQSRPTGNCCPKAISFNIGQTSVGITHRPNKSSRQPRLIFMPWLLSL